MSQVRLNVYGSTIETSDGPIVISNIMSPGRLEGNDFKVLGADLLGVSAGSCLLPDGIMLIEDADKNLVVPNSSAAVDYTIAYQLEDSRVLGGSPAVLRLISGIYRQEAFTDATVLGWIRYSGGSIPIANSMFIQPTSLKVSPQSNTLSFTAMSPFAAAIRPTTEIQGSRSTVSVPLTNGQLSQTIAKSLGGAARILSASVISDLGIVSNSTSYLSYTVKNGSVPLFSLNTNQTTLAADVPSPLTTSTSAALSSFVLDANTPATLEVTRTGLPSPIVVGGVSLTPLKFTVTGGSYAFSQTDMLKVVFFRSGSNIGAMAQIIGVDSSTVIRLREMGQTFVGSTSDAIELQNPGEVTLVVETPPATGKWTETSHLQANELVTRFTNVSTGASAELYTFKIPFIIDFSQPRKLIARLNVDYNCIVTFRLRINGTAITLSPSDGKISNTVTLVTSELNIPATDVVTWQPGSTGVIEVEINAQSSRGAAFAYIALVQEASPFRVFA